ncbi:MAG: TonB-dependent receptor [Alphaproteobacteria bacterium]|nr:TonB-dependent receptor [Alphaproteobacteria bacterium]
MFAAFAALLVASPALAQTTGSLRVTVVDSDEFEIPNAEVTLSSPSLPGGAQMKTTSSSGIAVFSDLPPASNYKVEVKSPAGEALVENVPIKISREYALTVTVAAGEVIVVEAKEKAVDTSSTSRGSVLTKEFLQRVPSGRTYQTAVQQAAGVAVGTGQGGNPNIGGAAQNENTYMLDGANITDPVTGTFSVNFNFDAIQQIEVLLGGYMPEYGVSLGGVVNVVTDSGSNNLEFNSSVFYTNGDWRPRMDERISADGTTLAPNGWDNTFQTIQIGAIVKGPVIRDKAFFILSYQHSRSLIAVSGTPQSRDFDAHYVLGKLTVQPSSEHRFTAFLQMDPTTIDNTYQGSPFLKDDSQGRQTQGGAVTSARWQWFLSPETNLDTVFTFQKSFIEASSVPCTHNRDRVQNKCQVDEAEGEIDWYTPGRIGQFGAFDSVNNIQYYFDDRFRFNLSSKLSLLAIEDPLGGTHDFKFGVEGSQLIWDQTQGINGNLVYYDLLAVPFDPESFANYFYVEYSKPIKFRTTGSQFNFFLQDSWKPVPNLTINYGTRFDNSVMRNDLGEPVLSANMWGPRLFAAWDPWGDQKTKIATGYGRFNDTGRLSVADFTSQSGYGAKLFLGEYFGSANGTGFLNNQTLNYEYDPATNFNTSHDTLRNPRTDELVLILEREVITDFALSSSMSGKFTRNIFEFDDINIIYDENGSTNIGSRFGDPDTNRFRIRTPQLAKRDVFQWDLSARKVVARRWGGQIIYTYSQAFGSSNSALSGSFANDPQTQYNYGNLLNAQNHVVRVIGIWDLPTDPWTQQIGLFFVGASGYPIDRAYWSNVGVNGGFGVRQRPRGTYTREPGFWDLSVRFQQVFDVRKGRLKLSVEAQNITNNRAGGFVSQNFIAQTNRYVLLNRQDPFRLQLGAIYEF